MSFSCVRLGPVIAVIAAMMTGKSLAGDAQAACGLDQSSVPFELHASTSTGIETVHVERLGDTARLDGRKPDGRPYTLLRRNGYDLTWRFGSRTLETTYPDGLTDTSIAVARPSRITATTTILSNDEVKDVVHPVTKVTYLGNEQVLVGSCSFETVHLLEEPSEPVPDKPITRTHKWYSPGLNVILRTMMDRREPDGSTKRVYSSEVMTVTPASPPGP